MRISPSRSPPAERSRAGRSDETTDGMPWLRAGRGRCCASMSEWVRKMTTRSVTRSRSASSAKPSIVSASGAELVDLQQHHRHVVVLRRVADERRDLAQHPLAQLVRRQVARAPRPAGRAAPRRSSRRCAFIASLMPSVKSRKRSPGCSGIVSSSSSRSNISPLSSFRPSTMPSGARICDRRGPPSAGGPARRSAACGRRARRSSCRARRSTTA